MRALRLAVVCVGFAGPCVALAQDQVPAQPPVADETTVTVDRGLTDDLPYTLVYPDVLRSVDDGSETTIATLQFPDAPFQCDAMIGQGAPVNWSPQGAIASLDKAGTEQGWLTDFPGFKITALGLTKFQSGLAMLYEGDSDSSPMGIPAHVFHSEAVDGGRTYILECLVGRDIVDKARPLVEFLLANFSTRSDGSCCIDPATTPPQ